MERRLRYHAAVNTAPRHVGPQLCALLLAACASSPTVEVSGPPQPQATPTHSAPTEAKPTATEPQTPSSGAAPAPAKAPLEEAPLKSPPEDGCYAPALHGHEPPTLHGIASHCAADMISMVREPLVVDLHPSQARDLPFTVTDPSKCLRLIAAGGTGVEDIELSLVDRAGRTLAKDEYAASFSVLSADGSVCVAAPGTYRALLKMVRGEGKVAVQAWRTK